MRRLGARRRASWVVRKTRLRSHSANARTVPRTQAWMTRLRLMRACCSISKDNGGTEVSFLDIVSSYAAVRVECRSNRRRDVRLEARLECLRRFPGDFL